MKRFFLLSALSLLLASCSDLPPDPDIQVQSPTAQSPSVHAEATASSAPGPLYRYKRSIPRGDTLYLCAPTPDRGLVFRYCYVQRRLHHIDVFDYAGESSENVLDFQPAEYQILVDGRDRIPDHYSF